MFPTSFDEYYIDEKFQQRSSQMPVTSSDSAASRNHKSGVVGLQSPSSAVELFPVQPIILYADIIIVLL